MPKGMLHKILRDYPFKPFTYEGIKHNGTTPGSYDDIPLDACGLTNIYYAEGMKALKISGYVKSSNSSHIKPNRLGQKYSVEVDILNVDRLDGISEEEVLAMQQGQIEPLYPRPSLSEKTIQIRCNCESYRFRFAQYNKLNGANSGNIGTFHISKTDRSPNNPMHWPGECKHIRAFVNYLLNNGYVTQ